MSRKMRLLVELEVHDHVIDYDDQEQVDWLVNSILYNRDPEPIRGEPDPLYLHSHEVGDSLGGVMVLEVQDDGTGKARP